MYPFPSTLLSHPGCHITLSSVLVQYSRSLLDIHFKYSTRYTSIPNFLAVPPRWQPEIRFLSLWVSFWKTDYFLKWEIATHFEIKLKLMFDFPELICELFSPFPSGHFFAVLKCCYLWCASDGEYILPATQVSFSRLGGGFWPEQTVSLWLALPCAEWQIIGLTKYFRALIV